MIKCIRTSRPGWALELFKSYTIFKWKNKNFPFGLFVLLFIFWADTKSLTFLTNLQDSPRKFMSVTYTMNCEHSLSK